MLGLFVGLPTLIMLLRHQRKMTALLSGKQDEERQALPVNDRLARLEAEVAFLRDRLDEGRDRPGGGER